MLKRSACRFCVGSSQSKVESSWMDVSPFMIQWVKLWSNPIKSMKLIEDSLFYCSFLILIVTKLWPVSFSLTFQINYFLNFDFDSSYEFVFCQTISWMTSFFHIWNEEMLIYLLVNQLTIKATLIKIVL